MGFHNHAFHRFRNAAEDVGGYLFGFCGCPPTAGSQFLQARRVCQVKLLGVKVCREEVVVVAALRAIAEPAAIQLALHVHRTGPSCRLLPRTPDFLFQPPVIADNLHCSREIHRTMHMCVGRKVLWEEDAAHAKIDREAPRVTDAVHVFVEEVTERRANVLDAWERKLSVGVQGNRVGVIVVGGPVG